MKNDKDQIEHENSPLFLPEKSENIAESAFSNETNGEFFNAKEKFSTPHKLVPGGRAAGWFETTIDDWMATQAERPQVGNPK